MRTATTAPLIWDIEIDSWSGDDATVLWTDAAGEHRAVVCVELEAPDYSVGYAGGVAYGGDDVPRAVEEYLAQAAADRALDKYREAAEDRDDWAYASRNGDL